MNITQLNFIDHKHQTEIDDLYKHHQKQINLKDKQEIYLNCLNKLESYIFGNNWKWIEHYRAAWITINTRVSKSIEIKPALEIIEKKIKSLHSRKKLINNCVLLYCYEFHTKTNNHLHVHLLLFKHKEENRFGKKDMIKFFFDKRIMDNEAKIHVEYPKKTKYNKILGINEKRCREVIKYILGEKSKKVKKENVEKDREFRRNWNLKECYLKGDRANNGPLFRFLDTEIAKYIHQNPNEADFVEINAEP